MKTNEEMKFDSNLFWSTWNKEVGSVTPEAKERHEIIQYIMDMKTNNESQDELEQYSTSDLKNIKE